MPAKLISFIMFSRDLKVVKGFLDNIEETVKDPGCIELLIKLDSDQPEVKPFIEEEAARRPFQIKYIVTSRLNGLTSLWLACNQLFLMSSKEAYFVQSISDEVRFQTLHWDEILRKYIGYFSDHVFRLRMSTFKLHHCVDPFHCNVIPDSFPIYTRQWLALTMGFGSFCWASDVYHQSIAYHLALGEQGYRYFRTPFYDQGISRDIPLLDIQFTGLEFGVGVSSEMMKNREQWMIVSWYRNVSHIRQEHFSYLAKRISSYIWAKKNNLNVFVLKQNKIKKTVQVMNADGVLQREVSYALPRLNFYLANFKRRYMFSWMHFRWQIDPYVIPIYNRSLNVLNKILNLCLPYQESNFFRFLLRFPLPRSFQSFLKELVEIDQQLVMKQYGRIQKNLALVWIGCYGIFNAFIDRVEKFMIGSPPGLPADEKFLGMIAQPQWPVNPVHPSEEDMKEAMDEFVRQNAVYQEMEEQHSDYMV